MCRKKKEKNKKTSYASFTKTVTLRKSSKKRHGHVVRGQENQRTNGQCCKKEHDVKGFCRNRSLWERRACGNVKLTGKGEKTK